MSGVCQQTTEMRFDDIVAPVLFAPFERLAFGQWFDAFAATRHVPNRSTPASHRTAIAVDEKRTSRRAVQILGTIPKVAAAKAVPPFRDQSRSGRIIPFSCDDLFHAASPFVGVVHRRWYRFGWLIVERSSVAGRGPQRAPPRWACSAPRRPPPRPGDRL